MSSHANDEILRLLQGGAESEEKIQTHVPASVPITNGTMEKAYTICKIVSALASRNTEWFSFLLASKEDQSYVVRDLIIPDGVKAGEYEVSVDGEAHAQAAEEVRRRNKEQGTDDYIIGWLHSHASARPAHSSTDDNNFSQLLNSIRFNTEKAYPAHFQPIEGMPLREIKDDSLVISGTYLEDLILKHSFPGQQQFDALLQKYDLRGPKRKAIPRQAFLADLLELMPVKMQETTIVGFGYSIVVNNLQEEPYAEIGEVERKAVSDPGKSRLRKYKAGLSIIEEDDSIVIPDVKELAKMVKSRITFERRKYFWVTRSRRDRRAHQSLPPTGDMFMSEDGRYYYEGSSSVPPRVSNSPSTSNRWSNYTPPFSGNFYDYTPETHPKVKPEKLEWDELARLFVLKAQMYLTQYRYDDVRYAGYLDKVLREMWKKTSSTLTEAVRAAGKPVEDAAEVPEPCYYRNIPDGLWRQIHEQMPKESDHPETKFLMKFVFGDANEAIEKYIPPIVENAVPSSVISPASLPSPSTPSSPADSSTSENLDAIIERFSAEDGSNPRDSGNQFPVSPVSSSTPASTPSPAGGTVPEQGGDTGSVEEDLEFLEHIEMINQEATLNPNGEVNREPTRTKVQP